MSGELTFENGLMKVSFGSFGIEAYETFIKSKKIPETQTEYDWERDIYSVTAPARFAKLMGVAVPAMEAVEIALAAHLRDYQGFIVPQAFHAKRFAVFADCGLGKTAMFLEWARWVMAATGGKVLILSPLQVISQTTAESTRWYGDALPIGRLDTREELEAWLRDGRGDLGICNYDKFIPGVMPDLRRLAGLIADESSILKTGGGVIKWNVIKSARGIEYKLSCTATPAPNEVMEYASQAAFLEQLRSEGEILWTFFSRDKRGEWTIKDHARDGFYRFLASWSIYLRNPAVYGWKDALADVPAPIFEEIIVPATDEQLAAAGRIFVDSGSGLMGDESLGVTARIKLSQLAKGFIYEADGKKRTARAVKSMKPSVVARWALTEIADGRKTLIWTVFDEEAEILATELRANGVDALVLSGATKEKDRAGVIERFADHTATGSDVLIGKASMLGFGLNLQFVGAMIFSGFNDSYEQFYQAVRRAYRYGQTKRLRVYLPYVQELEGVVWQNLLRKQGNFEEDANQCERFYKEALEGLI